MAVPYTFGNATTSIPLSQLDTNFATAITIGNTAVYLGNTTTSFGNVTLTNATISSGNATLTKVTVPTVDAGSGNALTLQSNSTTGLYIDTSQNVGIGTSSPSSLGKLAVQCAAEGTSLWLGDATNSTLLIKHQSPNNLLTYETSGSASQRWVLNSAEAMRIDSSGNVGIGTSSPSTFGKFAVTGAVATTSIDSNGVRLQFSRAATSYIEATNASGSLSFGTGGTDTNRMFIDSSGNVGIGTTSPASRLEVKTTDGTIARFRTTSGSNQPVITIDASDSAGTVGFSTGGNSTFPAMTFSNGGSERMRIDSSGNLLVGTTSTLASGKLNVLGTSNVLSVQCDNASAAFITTNTSGTAAYSAAAFHNNGSSYSLCGSIGVSGSTTSYNTSSDYRLKNSITSLAEGLSVISALKPVTYKWNADGSSGEGFIAHELAEHIPLAVTGDKDAVDKDGKIIPQGVDYSKIVVHLVSAVQQLKAELDALKGTK